jgi:hypothetical protein
VLGLLSICRGNNVHIWLRNILISWKSTTKKVYKFFFQLGMTWEDQIEKWDDEVYKKDEIDSLFDEMYESIMSEVEQRLTPDNKKNLL